MVFLILSLVSLAHLYPILPKFFTALPYAWHGDVNLTLGILYSNVNKLAVLDFASIYHSPIIFPYSYGLTMGFTMFGQALFLLPFHLLGLHNVYIIYNVFTFLCYILAGYCAYLFFRELTESQKVSLIAASLYMLLEFRVSSVPHLNLMCNFTIPLCFFFLLRYLKGSRRPDLILFNVFLLLQFLFDLSHGFYLAVGLTFFYLIFMLTRRKVTAQNTLGLIISLIPTLVLIIALHYPFLKSGLSLSVSIGHFDPGQYHLSSDFYSGFTYFYGLFLRRPFYGRYYPGFAVSFFFMLAFIPYVRRRAAKLLYWAGLLSLFLPALFLTLYKSHPSWQLRSVEAVMDIALSLFALSLAALLVLIRGRLDEGLKVTTWTYLALLAISFWPFPRVINLFGLMARVLPFLARSRGGLRTMYIVTLLGLSVVAFGLRQFFTSRKRSPLTIILILVLLFAEQLRRPVPMGRTIEPGSHSLIFYKEINRLPIESGVLELPLLNPVINNYTLFTRFHNKHTYHGHLVYRDKLQLFNRPELNYSQGFPGLKDEGFIQFLNQNRLRIILINRRFVPENNVWLAIRRNIELGKKRGLYERVEKNSGAILLVSRDRVADSDTSVHLPYYFFLGKRRLLFHLETPQSHACQVSFNGILLAAESKKEGGQWLFELAGVRLKPQLNTLRVKSDQPVVLSNVHFE